MHGIGSYRYRRQKKGKAKPQGRQAGRLLGSRQACCCESLSFLFSFSCKAAGRILAVSTFPKFQKCKKGKRRF